MSKLNDWLVASLNNPDFSVADFKNISDLSLDNTQFLNEEVYKSSPFIRNQKIFQDSDGKFSDKKFDAYYKNAASSFKDFSVEDIVDDYEYSMWDTSQPKNGKIKSINFNIGTAINPDHNRISVEGINAITLSDKSRRELALDSKIFDPSTGKFLNNSVNDISLFSNPFEYVKSLFDDPLVYATYDKDTVEIDPITGNKVVHKAGEWKVNEDGEYYTEKSNGRSLRGKQVVSVEDYITSENSILNQVDFFDSDDQQKSVAGVIAKNIAAVIPMFIPYIGTASKIGGLVKSIPTIYSGLLVGRELAKTLPMAYGMVSSALGDPNPDSKLANTIAAYGLKFTGSTSDYALEHTFAAENFGNLMSDVALLWGLQKFIADTFNKLSKGGETALATAQSKAADEYMTLANKYLQLYTEGRLSQSKLASYIGLDQAGNPLELVQSGKWAETALGKAALNKYMPAAEKIFTARNQTAQDLSLVYMALVSNTDVYESILEHGGTPLEAAALAFGSTLGMFAVDKYAGLGEMFFEKDPARKALRQAAKENADLFMTNRAAINVTNNMSTKQGIIGKIQKGILMGQKTVSDFLGTYKDGTVGIIGKALGEGAEEVGEEVVTDLTKYLGELAGKLGYFSQTDYGSFEDPLDRYAMSFLGGAAGGAMFGGVEAWNNHGKKAREFLSDLTTLIRQGKKDDLLKEITSLRKEGKLGSENLSYDSVTNEDGSETFLSADDLHISQAESNFRGFTNVINLLDFILNSNNLNLNNDDIFDKMVQGEYRAKALSDFLLKDPDKFKEASYITKYLDDFKDITEKIVETELEIKRLNDETTDPNRRNNPLFRERLQELQDKKQSLLEQKEYLFGEGSLNYVEQTLFAMDPVLSSRFYTINFHLYARERTGKNSLDLTSAERATLKTEWEDYKSLGRTDDVYLAFQLYKKMGANLSSDILHINDLNLNNAFRELERIRRADPNNKLLKESDKLPTETDEQYASLAAPKEGESREDYNKRVEAHKKAVNQYNIDLRVKWIEEFSRNPITSSDFRYFVSLVGALRHEIEKFYINLRGEDGRNFWELKMPNVNSELEKIIKDQNDNIKELITSIGFNNEDTLRDEILKRIKKTATLLVYALFNGGLNDEVEDWQPYFREINLMSEDEKEAINIPKDYLYDFESHGLSDADVYAALCYLAKKEAPQNNNSFEEDFEQKVDIFFSGLPTELLMLSAFNDPIARIALLSTPKANEIRSLTQEAFNKEIKETTKKLSDGVFKNFNLAIKGFKDSALIKSLNALESSTLVNNPLIPILNKISSFRSNTNVEELLKSIYDAYTHSEFDSEFQLSDTQVTKLKEILEDLDMAEAFLHGAKTVESNTNPIGHNHSINEFIRNHRDVFRNAEELVEISNDDYNTLVSQIGLYRREIKAWLRKHDNNSALRDIKFIKANEALNSVILDTIKLNRAAFKFSPTLDLLDGYEDLTLDLSLTSILQVKQLLYKNFKKSGLTITEVLDKLKSPMLDPKKIITLERSKLDENLTFELFTDYDKFLLIVSSLAVDPIKYYTLLKSFLNKNEKIAPIAILEYVSLLTFAQLQNPTLINEALEWLKTNSQSKASVAYNATIVEGLGGSGKTFAVAKLNLDEGTDTWVSGPTEFLVTNLKQALPSSVEKSKFELLNYIFGGTIPNLKDYFSKNSYYINTKELPTVKVTDAPKNIIIDEITHFDTLEIIAISKFCKENNINLLLIGDPHQNGTDYNILDNLLISWKTPELFLSLRNSNATKAKNLAGLVSMIDSVGGKEDIILDTIYNGLFKNFKLTHYNQLTFNGDVITSDPKEFINKIPKDATIGFVGNISTETHKYLKDNGYNVSEVINPTEVLGREFDYVIVDKDWKFEKTNDWTETNINMLTFLLDLYTMITRSTQGTILIDNGLSNIIGNSETKFSGTYTGLDTSVQKFREKRIPEIDKAIQDVPELAPMQPTNSTNNTNTTDNTGSTNGTSDSDSSNDTTLKPSNIEPEDISEEAPEKIEENNHEFDESIVDEDEARVVPEFPVSAFSSISYSGIDTSIKGQWTNNTNSTSDLGIFVKPGETLQGKDIYSTVLKLKNIKSLFLYGIENYKRLSNEIKSKFSKDAFDNARYFIKVEDATNSNTLIGFTKGTGLSNDDRTYKGKVIKVIAKIVGNDGVEYSVSLGGLNRPDTWYKNKDTLKAGILRLITKVQSLIDEGKEPSANIEDLKKLYNEYDSNITDYTNFLDELIKENLEYELLYPPKFSRNGLLRKLDHFYRLEYMNSSKSPYNDHKPIQVESPIYIITKKDIPGLDPSLKGKAVMFLSDNTLLSPSELKDIYLDQKQENSSDNRLVRMVVLSNVGVSWKSLYDRDFKDLYNTQRGNKVLTTPMKLCPFALRMYLAMWNYRADLLRFLERVDSDLLKKHNLTDKDLDEACKLDNLEYQRLRGNKNPNEFTEADYRKQCSEEVRKKVQVIWDFNDNLGNYVKSFRLGYEATHGAYIRKLTNIDDHFYTNPDDACGIYINAGIARQQKSIIENLFTNIVDRFIPPAISNSKAFINELLKTDPEKGEYKDWYKKLEAIGSVHMSFTDVDEHGKSKKAQVTSFDIEDSGLLSSFAFTMLKTAKYMGKLLFMGINDYTDFLVLLHEAGIELPYSISKKIGDTTETLEWVNILEGLKDDSVANSKDGENYHYSPGIIPYKKTKEGKSIGIYDSRLDDFFNLMLHGVVSTEYENTFLEGEIHATSAEFKYGIFSDPVLKTEKGVDPNELELGETGTSRKLFKCNAVISGPYIQIRLDPKENDSKTSTSAKPALPTLTTSSSTLTETMGGITPQEKVHNSLKEQLNKLDLLDAMEEKLPNCKSVESYINILNKKLQSLYKNWIQGNSTIDTNDLITSVSYDGKKVQVEKFKYDVVDFETKGQSKLLKLSDGRTIRLSWDNDLNIVVEQDITAQENKKLQLKQEIDNLGHNINDKTPMTAPEFREYFNNKILSSDSVQNFIKALNKVDEGIGDSFVEEWIKEVNSKTEGIGQLERKSIDIIKNNLKKLINGEYSDMLDEKDLKIIEAINLQMEALDTELSNNCAI